MRRDLVFIDTETSGLDAANPQHEVLEIAVVRLNPLTMERRGVAHLYFLPEHPVGPAAAAINGYSADLWRDRAARPIGDSLARLTPLFDGATPAGQNIDFDMRFLAREYGRIGNATPAFDYHRVDLMSLAYPLVLAGLLPGVSLKYQTRYFELGEQRHTAMEDVLHEIEVFERVMERYVNLWRDHAVLPPQLAQCRVCANCKNWGFGSVWPFNKSTCGACDGSGLVPPPEESS